MGPKGQEQRHEFLCREIERLIERHKAVPTDELKSRVSAQITQYVREMDEMEKSQRVANEPREIQESRTPFFGLHRAYPALGAGLLCTLLGILFGMSILTLGGLLVLLVAASSLHQSPSTKVDRDDGRSWTWKP